MSGAIVTHRYQVGQPLSDLARLMHRCAQQDVARTLNAPAGLPPRFAW